MYLIFSTFPYDFSAFFFVSFLSMIFILREDAQNPKFWSRVCLHNMAKLAKEVTTVRRVLESLFRYFDNEDLWSPDDGLALSVLLDMQLYIEDLGTFSIQSKLLA